jgi:hypothetical protein
MPDLRIIAKEKDHVVLEVQRGKQGTYYYESVIKALRWLKNVSSLHEVVSSECPNDDIQRLARIKIPESVESFVTKNVGSIFLEFMGNYLTSLGLFDSSVHGIQLLDKKAIVEVHSGSLEINMGEGSSVEKILVRTNFEVSLVPHENDGRFETGIDYTLKTTTSLCPFYGGSFHEIYLKPLMLFFLPKDFPYLTTSDEPNGFPCTIPIDEVDRFKEVFQQFINSIPKDKKNEFAKYTRQIFGKTQEEGILVDSAMKDYLFWLHELIYQKR